MDSRGIIAKVEPKNKASIDKLPSCILSHVLSFLPIKDAVDTCLLSQQWRHLWKHPILTKPNLEFDILNIFGHNYAQLVEEYEAYKFNPVFMRQLERQSSLFVRRVNEILLLYNRKKVDSFKVAYSFDADSTVILDEWVRFAITRGVEVLDIQLSSRNGVLDTENVYVFPHWLLSELNASTLRHLSLQRCILKPPTDFDIFIWLRTLCLNKVIVDPAFLAHMFSVCSLLESLTLSYCRGGSCLIVGPSLRLNDLKVLRCVGLKSVEIDAVNLSSFEYCGLHSIISCMRTPQLVRCFFKGCSFKGCSEGGISYALTQLASCPGLETLHLQSYYNEDIPQTVLTLRNLKQVNLDLFMGNFNLGSVLNILKAAPLLEEFIITVRATSYQGDVRNLSGFSHDHLRRFKMQGFQGKWIEIELAISILKIATNLEVLVIDPYGKYYDGGGSWIEIDCCYYREGYENEGKDDNEEKIFLHIEDSVDVVDLQYFWWKQRGSVVVRKRLEEVMTDAQVVIL